MSAAFRQKCILVLQAMCLLATSLACAQGAESNPQQSSPGRTYLGFDRNDYPGDQNLAALRKSFEFTGYWLNNPPGARQNTWAGKRALLKANGFGFALLFNGRLYADLKGRNAAALGTQDGRAAVDAALHEGFAKGSLIFLDQEQGGRLLQEQADYLFAWVDAVRAAGARAGIYCSAIDVPDGAGKTNTARDIVEKKRVRTKAGHPAEPLKLWIANDQCPPAPGCTLSHPPLSTAVPDALESSAVIWQYVQSPRRADFTKGCPKNYASDNKCYAPGMAHSPETFIDMNVSSSPDPSKAQ